VSRLGWAALGAAALTGAFVLAGADAWQIWVFLVLPDIALVAGMSSGLEKGQLRPRAVPLYNALHVLVGPTVLALASLVIGIDWFAGALAWTAHIAIDRALGYRLRDKQGFIRASDS
jgi:uncharacterized protein DUF4260